MENEDKFKEVAVLAKKMQDALVASSNATLCVTRAQRRFEELSKMRDAASSVVSQAIKEEKEANDTFNEVSDAFTQAFDELVATAGGVPSNEELSAEKLQRFLHIAERLDGLRADWEDSADKSEDSGVSELDLIGGEA